MQVMSALINTNHSQVQHLVKNHWIKRSRWEKWPAWMWWTKGPVSMLHYSKPNSKQRCICTSSNEKLFFPLAREWCLKVVTTFNKKVYLYIKTLHKICTSKISHFSLNIEHCISAHCLTFRALWGLLIPSSINGTVLKARLLLGF